MSRSKLLAAALAATALLIPIACSLGGGACLRMSDCEAPFMCVEGTCRSNEALGTPMGDGGALEASDQ